MELNGNSKLVRWAYLLRDRHGVYDQEGYYIGDSRAPTSTTLCRFFWRAFVIMPLFWLMITSLITALIVFAALAIWEDPWRVLVIVLCIIAGALILVGIIEGIKAAKKNETFVDTMSNSTFVQGLKAIKSKVCPIIYIK